MVVYKDYINMIRKAAHSRSNISKVPYEELFSEGNRVFMETCLLFDEEKGKFATYLWNRLLSKLAYFALYQYSRKSIKTVSLENGDVTEDKIQESIPPMQEREMRFKQMMQYLPRDAQMVVELVIDPPEELSSIVMRPKNKVEGLKTYDGTVRNTRDSLKRFLKRRNWGRARINTAFKEIEIGLITM